MESGVLQGSVLGPHLFIIFVNDIDVDVVSWLLKFADDLKRTRRRLQTDLDRLDQWKHTWQMKFNVLKRKVMHTGARNKFYNYFLGGQELMTIDEEMDLVAIIRQDLKCSAQCLSVYRKTS